MRIAGFGFHQKVVRAAVIAACIISGCATPPPANDPESIAAYKELNDPLEPMNRAIFDFNIFMDRYFLRPVAFVYKEGVPEGVQNMARHFLNNLQSPVILANDLLQGEWNRAGYTTLRFMMNTSFGFGGVSDIANDFGFPRHEEDFGQTLAVYGAGSGPYLMLPFLGPSSPRGVTGRIVDIAFDPLTYVDQPLEALIARRAIDIVSIRAKNYDVINELERTSLDYYATVRSLYRQRLKDEIRNGRAAPASNEPTAEHQDDDNFLAVPPSSNKQSKSSQAQ